MVLTTYAWHTNLKISSSTKLTWFPAVALNHIICLLLNGTSSMSERSTHLLLLDIRFSIRKILDYTAGMSFELYESDAKTRDAVERNFAIIGEAASRVPEEFKNSYPAIEWRVIKDFRNFIIHEYFGVDNMIVWDIIQHRLSDLLNEISTIIWSEEANS